MMCYDYELNDCYCNEMMCLMQGHGWKLNRTSYYQEGWLAAGNLKSVIGVTFTSTLSQRSSSWASSPTSLPLPPRTNYNLRGHRAQVPSPVQCPSISVASFFQLTFSIAQLGIRDLVEFNELI